MNEKVIKDLALIYVQLHATKDSTLEELIALYNEAETQIRESESCHQSKWIY